MRFIYKLFAVFIVCLTLTCSTWAQGENNIWTFGHSLSLNFNSGLPVMGTSSIMAHEGCAAVCDANGNLLFYSNGNDVWDRTHNVMPNGSGILSNLGPLGSTGSSTQGVAIMPFINDTNKYYLFVLESFESSGPGGVNKLRYNIIDKSLNNGLGDVVAGQKNIMLDTVGTEKLVLAKGAGCYNWLITHRGQTNEFVAWKIEATGINPVKVVSASGQGVNHMSSGEMKISHDSKRIALSVYDLNTVEIHDFNRVTGIVSNALVVDTAYNTPNNYNMLMYGMEFSPDNSKLYYSLWGLSALRQIDLSLLPNLAAVRASKIDINTAGSFVGMRMGPDGKIYICRPSFSRIVRINAPNNPGLSCGLDLIGVAAGSSLRWGLGNRVVINLKDTTRHRVDTSICLSAPFTYQVGSNYHSYTWSNGDNTASTTFTSPGTRTLIAYDGCSVLYDTVVVAALPLDTTWTSHQQTNCFNGGLSTILTAPAGYQTYLWSNGANTQQITINAPGTYTVVAGLNCVVKIDTFHVSAMPLNVSSQWHDSMVCFVGNNSLTVSSNSSHPNYLWNTGATTPQITVTAAGTYFVTATNACDVDVDTFKIMAKQIDTTSLMIDTVICFQDQILLQARSGFDAYQWQGGGTQASQWVNTSSLAIVNGYNASQCRLMFDTFRFDNVNFEPNLGNDKAVCLGDSVLLNPQTAAHFDYLWQDNSIQASLMARNPGQYWVRVSEKGCSKSDTMLIEKRHYEIDLGNDIRACIGSSVKLDATTHEGSTYLWNTGSIAPIINVEQSGMYAVSLTDGACTASDSVYVNFEHCENCLRLPNVFSPNGDGINDVFAIKPVCPVAMYQIKIYDRWGKQVFGSFSLHHHWDGTYNGQALDLGVYFYTITIRYDLPNAKHETFKGDITLIR